MLMPAAEGDDRVTRVYSLEVPGSPQEPAGLDPYPRTSSRKGGSARTINDNSAQLTQNTMRQSDSLES